MAKHLLCSFYVIYKRFSYGFPAERAFVCSALAETMPSSFSSGMQHVPKVSIKFNIQENEKDAKEKIGGGPSPRHLHLLLAEEF